MAGCVKLDFAASVTPAHVGVTVGSSFSVPVVGPVTSSLAPFGVIMTFRRHRRSDRVRNRMPGTCDWDPSSLGSWGIQANTSDAGVTDAVKSPEGQRGAGPSWVSHTSH